MPIWWLCFTLYESGWYEIVSPTHALSIHDIKIKSYGLVLELFWFQKWHVFAHFCIILPIQHARNLNFDALARPYERSRVTANKWKLLFMMRGIQIMWKFWILTFPRAVCAHNARADTYGRKILKCSKWPGSYSKLFIRDFEHFKILTRSRARGFGKARIWIGLYVGIWPEVYGHWIWLI